MAGVVGEINNNLLGLQQLAVGRQQLEQNSAASENNRIASESLRKYYASEQAGAPDTEALNEAFLRSPELAGRMLQGAGITDKRKGQDAADYALKAYQSIDNPQEFVDLTANRINYLQKTGRDASHTIKALEAYQSGQKEEVRKGTKLLLSSLANQGFVDKDIYSQVVGVNLGGSSTGRSEILEDGTVIQSTPTGPVVYSADGRRLTGSEAAQAVLNAQNYGANLQAQRAGGRAAAVGNVNLGLAPQIAAATDAAKAGVELATAPGIQAATTTAEEGAKNRNLYKTQAITTAENIPTLKRAIELQGKISTGGAANNIRALSNYLGSSSTDAGELNSLFNQNILGQLKSTFGGSPTEGERTALAQAQASYQQTGSINSKLLQNALKLADLRVKRGRAAAKTDNDSDTLDSIDSALSIDFSDEPPSKPATGGNVGRFKVEVQQ